ncbi:type II secretion system protein GspM [Aureimonas sp. AU12]|uniref:type II secretion system protein GspM n=1 Tax=Aureimonas sp. AU12 TaxID=1638161 RepID=UPI0009E88118|nr:type II secretion system protein GspM [Aureimonas sp. AU12]
MMERIAASPPLRRAAALAILASLAWLVAPLVLSPLAAFAERREAIASESTLLDRLWRQDARRAALTAAAGTPETPVIVADDRAAASALLQTRVETAAALLPEGLRIEALSAMETEDRPGTPVAMSVSFRATEGAFHAFLADIETRRPFLRVRELALNPALEADGTRVLNGSVVLSAVPLLRVSR